MRVTALSLVEYLNLDSHTCILINIRVYTTLHEKLITAKDEIQRGTLLTEVDLELQLIQI